MKRLITNNGKLPLIITNIEYLRIKKMGEVVELKQPDNEGYVTGKDSKSIHGVYVDNLGAIIDSECVYIGEKTYDGIDAPVQVSIEQLNRFCVLWLGINDPDELNEK